MVEVVVKVVVAVVVGRVVVVMALLGQFFSQTPVQYDCFVLKGSQVSLSSDGFCGFINC